jgi:hypothetical protein
MRKLLLTLALGLGLIAPAFGQLVTQPTLSGTECWNAGQGPGGPGSFICADLVRNSRQHFVGTIAGNLTLGTGTTAILADGGNFIATAQPAAATLTLPPNPVPDGAVVCLTNPTNAAFATNVVTFAANTNQTLTATTALTTLGAGSSACVMFNLANTNWYRIQ